MKNTQKIWYRLIVSVICSAVKMVKPFEKKNLFCMKIKSNISPRFKNSEIEKSDKMLKRYTRQ